MSDQLTSCLHYAARFARPKSALLGCEHRWLMTDGKWLTRGARGEGSWADPNRTVASTGGGSWSDAGTGVGNVLNRESYGGLKPPIQFLTQPCEQISHYGKPVERGPMKSFRDRFHWSTALVSHSNWSDRTTESENGSWPSGSAGVERLPGTPPSFFSISVHSSSFVQILFKHE